MLSPQAIELVPRGVAIDMPEVITKAIERGQRVSVFPIHEYWADIGTPNDLEQALAQFHEAEQ